MWEKINQYGNYYAVSDKGEIKSLKRSVFSVLHGKEIIRKEHELKYSLNHKGYKIVGLYKNKVHRTYLLHIIIAKTFIPNPLNLLQVNHKNGIKTDNRVANLEWCTGSQNIKHAFETGLFDKMIKNRNKKVIITSGGIKKTFESIKLASEYLKTSSGAVGNVLNGSRKTIKGYFVRYAAT